MNKSFIVVLALALTLSSANVFAVDDSVIAEVSNKANSASVKADEAKGGLVNEIAERTAADASLQAQINGIQSGPSSNVWYTQGVDTITHWNMARWQYKVGRTLYFETKSDSSILKISYEDSLKARDMEGLIIFFVVDGKPTGCEKFIYFPRTDNTNVSFDFDVSCMLDERGTFPGGYFGSETINAGSHMLEVYMHPGYHTDNVVEAMTLQPHYYLEVEEIEDASLN